MTRTNVESFEIILRLLVMTSAVETTVGKQSWKRSW
jgi:hypothetical protein